MEKSLKHPVLFFILFCVQCIVLALLVAGICGSAWWTSTEGPEKKDKGLWRICTETKLNGTNCDKNNHILGFSGDYKDEDAILVSLIVSTCFCFITIILSPMLGCCCDKQNASFSFGVLLVTLFTFISSVSSLGAMIYTEVRNDSEWEGYSHGWSLILGWIGSVFSFIGFIISMILLCVTPKNQGYQKQSFEHQYQRNKQMADRSANGMAKQGHEVK